MSVKPILIKCTCAVMLAGVASAYADDTWVQVKESVIRSQPLFYASSVVGIRYGDRLTRLSEDKGWARVRFGGKEGYVPLAVVTPQQVVLTARALDKIGADASEVVLAGKGFSREVEEQFKQSDSSARFDLVDRIERQSSVPAKSVQAFIKSGDLKG